MNKERRNRTKRGVFVVVLLLCIISLIGGTYSRYSSGGNVTAKVDIAKWAVKLDSTDISSSTVTKDITFTVESNSNVVANKIAPATKATAEVELDLTGTEVAVDLIAAVDAAGVSGLSNSQITLSSTVDGSTATTNTIALPDGAAFTAQNGKKKVILTLEWTNSDTNNAADTTLGVAGSTVSVPITLTVQQHIATGEN